MNKEINYDEDITIDVDALDIEMREQPRLMLKYTRHLAVTRKQVDEAKQNLDIKKAEVDRKIRENPEAYGIEGKVTEGAITSALLTEDDYIDAQKDFLDAKFEMDMAQGAVNAFEQRKSALENLIKLHGMNYFAGPKVPRDLSAEIQKREDQRNINRGIKSGLTRTK